MPILREVVDRIRDLRSAHDVVSSDYGERIRTLLEDLRASTFIVEDISVRYELAVEAEKAYSDAVEMLMSTCAEAFGKEGGKTSDEEDGEGEDEEDEEEEDESEPPKPTYPPKVEEREPYKEWMAERKRVFSFGRRRPSASNKYGFTYRDFCAYLTKYPEFAKLDGWQQAKELGLQISRCYGWRKKMVLEGRAKQQWKPLDITEDCRCANFYLVMLEQEKDDDPIGTFYAEVDKLGFTTINEYIAYRKDHRPSHPKQRLPSKGNPYGFSYLDYRQLCCRFPAFPDKFVEHQASELSISSTNNIYNWISRLVKEHILNNKYNRSVRAEYIIKIPVLSEPLKPVENIAKRPSPLNGGSPKTPQEWVTKVFKENQIPLSGHDLLNRGLVYKEFVALCARFPEVIQWPLEDQAKLVRVELATLNTFIAQMLLDGFTKQFNDADSGVRMIE